MRYPQSSYYDLPDEPEEFMSIDEYNRQMTDLRDYFLGVIEEIYGFGPINTHALDNCVQELCHILDLSSPEMSPNIRRDRERTTINFLETVDLSLIANIR